MMANQHDRLAERPPLDMVASDHWLLAVAAAVVAGLVLIERLG